jgi:hypothetical protein
MPGLQVICHAYKFVSMPKDMLIKMVLRNQSLQKNFKSMIAQKSKLKLQIEVLIMHHLVLCKKALIPNGVSTLHLVRLGLNSLSLSQLTYMRSILDLLMIVLREIQLNGHSK